MYAEDMYVIVTRNGYRTVGKNAYFSIHQV